MLQMILNRVIAIDKKVESSDGKTQALFEELKGEILENRTRIDKFGHELVELSEDAPVMEDFEILEQKVEKLEHKFATLQKE